MTDEDIRAIADAFIARTLPKADWTHDAHFATALWLMLKRPDLRPERDMGALIRRYNESVGGVNDDNSGYHETITQASLRMARRLLADLPDDVAPSVAFAAVKASPLSDKDWLFAYWSRSALMTPAARRDWLEPDIKPMPA
ncbi:hypothetical protein LL253_02305 [Sphingobium soli]|uniref:Uncharacterized protein n=1 Tax=Sphingobium soli TaxID=1591116 RepID=A0ABS8GZ24_9SPHN|nr:hypothetical protein [Sphingobium soli]MCC4231520.1 hypothetical protein [Sphingobium soli]